MGSVKRLSLDNDLIMGIDLGTTNSAVAVYTAGLVPSLCPMGANGKTTLQSCVRWDGGEKFTVGPEAYKERYKTNVAYSVKRLMGSEEKIILVHPDSGEMKEFTPVELSAEILKALKSVVWNYYGEMRRCIITVPAYFNQRQIEDTIAASKLAGLDCVQILKEPTSASYIYSNLGYVTDGSVLIYDLGGGTFDITVMSFLKKSNIPAKVTSTLKRLYKIDAQSLGADDTSLYYCRVLGTYGNTRLGGDDIDEEMARIISKGQKLNDVQWAELVLRCEQFKKNNIESQDICVGEFTFHATQEALREAVHHIFLRTMDLVKTIPEDQLAAIRSVVLVGGSTKSAYLVEYLEDAFPGMEISRVLDPDATVALGAGAVAKDLQEGRGASYQDVLPLPIGVLDNESEVDICIPKNTAMPYSVSRVYHTMYDNQQAISIDLYQGLSKVPAECVYLGKLRIDRLPQRTAGELSVTVSFLLSAQGRLEVTTTVEGVSEVKKLTIDSIFSVVSESASDTDNEFNHDEFEQSLASLCADNPELVQLLRSRREALLAGDLQKVNELEEKVLEAL